ncbi:general transcription factor 3C polypeptide 3-like isoform X2 [Watersipora subatra]|uniref:general transcription factor 3C polypeptide 3-like isoform X2 n=1 Tax=Watersipora subatra TaxID=2589382 RepID=UPI00355B2FA8
MADDMSDNDSADDAEYRGISEKTLRYIGVNPGEHASGSGSSNHPHKVDEVIKMLMSNSKQEEAEGDPNYDPNYSPNKGRRQRMVKSRLSKELQGLMGEANLKFARGEYDEVIAMCREIIRSAPTAPDPYQTLSMLHEEMGDHDTAYQCGLVGAHLDPRNTEEWLRLADMAEEADNKKDCSYCYRQVAKYDRENTPALLKCAELERELGQLTRCCEVLQWILDSNSANSDSQLYMSITKHLVKLLYGRGKHDKAVQVLEKAVESHPEFITSEEVNLLADFYVADEKYSKVIELLKAHCGVTSNESGGLKLPEALPLDLRSKLIVTLIYQSDISQAEGMLDGFKGEDVNEVGDLLLDISDALQENGQHAIARQLLERLVASNQYNMAAVWLKYSECLSALGLIKLSADAYGKVVELAPNHVSARVQLSLLQQQLGLDQEALHTLAEGGVEASTVRNDWTGLEGKEPRLLLHTCLLLHSQEKLDEFFRYVQYLLFGQLPPHIVADNELSLMSCKAYKGRMAFLRRVLPEYDKVYKNPPALSGGDNSLNESECWDLFNQACSTCSKHKLYDTLFVLVKSAFCTHAFFSKKNWNDELEFRCICCHILLRHGGGSFDLFRDTIMKMVANPDGRLNQISNIFSMITSISTHDVRFSRFSERLLRKHPSSSVMNIVHGHASIIFSSYRAAINQFITAYKQSGESPMLNLLIGICFLHIVCMKFTTQRATLAIQGICFLDRYLKLRGECQETFYNLGRAMHQLSINSAAVYYYQRCLQMKPSLPGEEFDLSKDAAFNLSLIYKANGSHELADHMLQTYCII